MKILNKISILLVAGILTTSCTVKEFSDLNGPEVGSLVEDLSRGDLQDLVGGVFYSMRLGLGNYYDDTGVIGREFYRFSSSDPRLTADLLGRENAILDNNTFYITTPWAARYRTVKNVNIILEALDNSTADFSEGELNATKGFLKTIKAHELLMNLNLTDQNGIRIDVSDPENLGPVVSKSEALTAIRSLLEDGASNLAAGGDSFPFSMTGGFDGFDSPTSFLEVNKGLSARVAAYQEDFPAVLSFLEDSFLDFNGDLYEGIYYVFSEDQNDLVNPVFFPENASAAGVRIVQPGFIADAEAGDDRVESKTSLREETITFDGLTGDYDFLVYKSRTESIPIIRNAELILLYAEANIYSNPDEAVKALNIIRNSASLSDYTGANTEAALIEEMLMQRRYELYGEGHRWIDARRYDILNTLPIDRTGDDVFTQFPIPLTENQ
ncbi:RagB/SusD family nutrient uptake outer membrane protein [Gillisia sp. CAL575]|uniref:RagB/SusD family nutrient uptake outer membrane protein n=1 Tax=Gillisia sp. CAL575 TaxID=985255 RepID=UPI0003A02F47|nr:RagB/SusD family nutrient uptake outer membrane protein [Gillisia sp. CAL575]